MIKTLSTLCLVLATLCIASAARADQGKKSPTSKMYVADTLGDAQIDNGTEIDDLTKKAVYNAAGTIIETKAHSNASAVLSNGTGLFFDVNTRVEIRSFEQESFRPNRSDMEDEPSVSTTHVVVDYGVIGVSTSKLVPGSVMVYDTSLASASIRGRQAVIMASDNSTVVSMIQGDATVQGGATDLPHVVNANQQIVIKPGRPGQANVVVVQEIPDGELAESRIWLEERVLTADAARKLVYFEVQARKGDNGDIALFNGTTGAADAGNQEIVAVPVVPVIPVVGPVVSPANLTSH